MTVLREVLDSNQWTFTPLAPELRSAALDLLRSKGSGAYGEIEKLMGWEGPIGMTQHVMAQKLGVTKRQLKWLLSRHYLREKEIEQRSAEKHAGNVALVAHVSRKLRFSISLPAHWQVITDTHEWSRLAQEYLEYIRRSKLMKEPTHKLAYARVSADGGIRPLSEFEERLVAKEEYEERKANAERHAWVEQMAIGLFQAEPPNREDGALVEVTKLKLESELTALDLYKLDKNLPHLVGWGSRPNKAITVDGLPAVVYYFTPRCGLDEVLQESPVYFNVYLSDGREGWLLSCKCHYGELYFKTFAKYKPLFRRVIGSFQRIRAV